MSVSFSSIEEFESHMEQFKPQNCVSSKTITNHNGHMIRTFYTETKNQLPNKKWSAHFAEMESAFALREKNHYLPLLGVCGGIENVTYAFYMFSFFIAGRIYKETNPTTTQGPAKGPQYEIKNVVIEINPLTCCQRLIALALSIILLIRGLVEIGSLGIINFIFAPVDAILQRYYFAEPSHQLQTGTA